MLKQNKQNKTSAKVNYIEQVKLEFNNDDLYDNENKIIEQSKKRSMTIDKRSLIKQKKIRSILFEPKFRLHLYNHINVNWVSLLQK